MKASGFEKQPSSLTYTGLKHYSRTRYCGFFFYSQNATEPLGNITGGNVSDYMQLPLEPQKAHLPFNMPCDLLVMLTLLTSQMYQVL